MPIKIYISFFIFLIINIALGYLEQFFIMVLVVTIHEFSHIAVAKIFGLHAEKILITPLGQIAIIKDLVFLAPYKKILVVLVGPFTNLFLACMFIILNIENSTFININLIIGFFNLIPAYPFDGGRLCHFILSNRFGVLQSNKILYKTSLFMGFFIVILGFFQVMLYPLNISLIIMGAFVLYVSYKEYFHTSFEFYRNIILKSNTKETPTKKKCLIIDRNIKIKKIINLLNYDVIYYFLISDKKGVHRLSQEKIIHYVQKYGVHGYVRDIL